MELWLWFRIFSVINASFICTVIPFVYIYFYFPLSRTRLSSDLTTWVTRRISYRKWQLLTLREHVITPRVFRRVRVAHLLSFLYCVLLLALVLCLCLMLPISLDRPSWLLIGFLQCISNVAANSLYSRMGYTCIFYILYYNKKWVIIQVNYNDRLFALSSVLLLYILVSWY